MAQMSWISGISRMFHGIWSFPNDENPDKVKNGTKVNCPSDILVERWLSLRFLQRHIPPQSNYSPIAKRVGESHDQFVGIQKVWKWDTIWEKCSLDAERHADYCWVPYTFSPRHIPPLAKNSLFLGRSHEHALDKLGTLYHTSQHCISLLPNMMTETKS